MLPEVDGATISKKVTFFVDNYSDKPVRQALLENLPDLKDAIIEALKNALRGKSPSYSFEKTIYDMGNILKIMNCLETHRRILFSNGIEKRSLKDYKQDDLVHTLFMEFIPEDEYTKPNPMIKEILIEVEKALKDPNYRDEEKTISKKQAIKEKLGQTIDFCGYCADLDGRPANLNEFLKIIKEKVYRKYPELTTRRKITEHRVTFKNLKFMCDSVHKLSMHEETDPKQSVIENYQKILHDYNEQTEKSKLNKNVFWEKEELSSMASESRYRTARAQLIDNMIMSCHPFK
ncbi:uncharacterized protein isoform X2 [Rhodnius prolixus]|uniref:Uncharacterized protein n=1 Tax=Rhodnius prolixus TaxID=13249 RepID=T1HTT9_RHOPR